MKISHAILERLLKCFVGDFLYKWCEIALSDVEKTIWLKIGSAESQDINGGQLGLGRKIGKER